MRKTNLHCTAGQREMNEPAEMIQTVERIAWEAGCILIDYHGEIRQVEYKGIGDILAEAHKAWEQFIKTSLEPQFPNDATLGEEFGLSDIQSDSCWVTDLLDGTANYTAGLPIFSMAIGLLHKGSPILGVVFDPSTDRLFSAIQGQAATVDGVSIHVNEREKSDLATNGKIHGECVVRGFHF